MADLRITGVTNNQLELQAPDGTRHYLEISDDLLKAMKSRRSSNPSNLTPREIQTEIRLGVSVEELVARTGADEDHVTRYATPIITELNHIVTLARNIRLSLAGDRFTDPSQIEFGTVMDDRLKANGATNTRWSSRKSVEGEWLVSARYHLSGVEGTATWSFDPKNLLLVPDNQSALQLSNSVPLSLGESAKVSQPGQMAHPTNTVAAVVAIEEVATPTAGLSVVPELEDPENSSPENVTEVLSIVETETRASFHIVENDPVEPVYESESSHDEHQPDESYDSFDDVIEDLDTTEKTEPEDLALQEIEAIEVVEVVEVVEKADVADDTKTSEETYSPTKAQSTSRWAEVLFGSKDEDDN
jgi:hypothetical protein